MISPKIQKLIVVIVTLLVIGFLGYRFYTDDLIVFDSSDIISETEMAGQQILTLVANLQTISIDQEFFTSSLFSRLNDFSQIVYPEPRGRINPFAKIGTEVIPSIGIIGD